MPITGAIAQLRTTNLAESIRFVQDVHETAWGTRELVIKDDQGHTLYVGEDLSAPRVSAGAG
jgi:hypothetical protein